MSRLISLLLEKVKRLQTNGLILPSHSIKSRISFYVDENGPLSKPLEQEEAIDPMQAMQNSPMGNPEAMFGMLKGSLVNTLIFPLQYSAINYFFSGMFVGKTPFPLTQKFREMLQKGLGVHNIDVKYISSLSLYFLCFLGIEKFFSIFGNTQGVVIRSNFSS